MYSEHALRPWVEAARGLLPPDVALFDAHTHLGLHDPAALLATEDELLGALERVGARALVFPLKEPGGYRGANEKMRALAAAHPERLDTLVRVDPAADPLEELDRGLEAGAVGLKLHPRGEGFDMDDQRLVPVYQRCDERRLPIMVHAGVGEPAIGSTTVRLAQRFEGARFILAHCACGSTDPVLEAAADVPNLLFDTSWWNLADFWAVLRTIPPGQVLFASDVPFASPSLALVMTVRMAVQAGYGEDHLRSLMGGQLARLASGEDLVDLGPVPDTDPTALRPELERLYVVLSATVEPMLRGEAPGQGLDIARVQCSDPTGPHADLIASIGELLELAEEQEDPDPLRAGRTPGWDLVLAAATLARTPAAGVP